MEDCEIKMIYEQRTKGGKLACEDADKGKKNHRTPIQSITVSSYLLVLNRLSLSPP